MDYGWTLGFGMGLEMGNWLSTLEIRGSRGMARMLEDRETDNPRTRSAQLTLGLGRRLKR
jgi:hypothetical protein